MSTIEDLHGLSLEDMANMADHLAQTFPSKQALFQHVALLPANRQTHAYRQLLAGLLDEMIPPPPPHTYSIIVSAQPFPYQTLEDREDWALQKTQRILETFTDEKWQEAAMQCGQPVDTFRREIWKRIFLSLRKFG